MGMFANAIVWTTLNDVEQQVPVCPLCKENIEPGTSGITQTPTGTWIVHTICVKFYNARNQPGAEWA